MRRLTKQSMICVLISVVYPPGRIRVWSLIQLNGHLMVDNSWNWEFSIQVFFISNEFSQHQNFVCNYFFLEQPWDDYSCPIRVGRNITSLKWSQSGEKLLIGDSLGRLILFTMHEYSSSEWDQEILYEGMDRK